MLTLNLKPGTLNLELNVSHLPPGIYFCKVQAYNNTWVKKLIKL
jgi:hypothetical protein